MTGYHIGLKGGGYDEFRCDDGDDCDLNIRPLTPECPEYEFFMDRVNRAKDAPLHGPFHTFEELMAALKRGS